MEFCMKMTAGMGAADDYITLAEAGANEVFCGFVPLEWNLKFGNGMPLNRREVLFYHVQIGSYNEMKILKNMQKKYHVPVAVTFNALYYTEEQIQMILGILERLIEIGFRDFIIADPGLMLSVKRKNLPCNIHMSGEIGEWNCNTIKLWNEILCGDSQDATQLKRIIFHRKNTIADMKACVKFGRKINPKLEYEAFFLNEMCHFTGGFCNSLHCDELVHMCQMPYELVSMTDKEDNSDPILQRWNKRWDIEEEDNLSEVPGNSGCGLCALWKLSEIGITHLKIVGRGKSISCMKTDVENVKKAIELLRESRTEREYISDMKRQLFKGKCSGNCYYREISDEMNRQ